MGKDIQIQKSFLYMAAIVCLVYCSQFNEALLISKFDPIMQMEVENINYPIQFEFWSFFISHQQVIYDPWVEQQYYWNIFKDQLLILIKNQQNNEVFFFMYTKLMTSDYVIHKLHTDNKIFHIAYDPSEYEGIWILHLITLYQQKMVYQASGAMGENLFQTTFEQSLNKIQISIGGTEIIDDYILGIFRGRLSKLFIHYSDVKFEDIYSQRIKELRINEYEQKISLIPDLINFDGLLQKEFEFDQFGRKFSIFGWAKYYIYNAYSLKQYLLVRLTIFKNYLDETKIGDEVLKIVANLDLSSSQNCGYDIISHHYWLPYPQYVSLSQNDKISLRDDLPYQELLTKWHFISFEYGIVGKEQKTQFILSHFENKNLISNTYYLGNYLNKGLFVNTKFYAIFGGDSHFYLKTLGQLSGFYFISNYQNDLNIQIKCHQTCLTCDGPLNTNCLTCDENSGKVFWEDLHQCGCRLGQIEENQKCYSFNDIYKTLSLVEIQIELTNSKCLFGYFYLPIIQQCIKCPQWNSYNLFCVDCILDSANWYKRPICKTDFITQQVTQDQDAYTQEIRSTLDYDLYYIDNNYNLLLVEGVYDFCDITQIQSENCFELGIQHLQSITFGLCKKNLYYINKSCKLLDSACANVNQKEQQCLECISGYYVSKDYKSCLQCPKYCLNCQSETICQNCEIGFGLENGSCNRCGDFCKTCKYSEKYNIMQCQTCLNKESYYLSLNAKDCKRNQIENCKYAFESLWDRTVNSLDYDFHPQEDENTYPQCAKCKDGYYYIQDQNICLEGQLDTCQQFFDRGAGYRFLVCLFGPYQQRELIYSFSDKCSSLKLGCVHCLIEQFTINYEYDYYSGDIYQILEKATYGCIACENGYYAEKRTGYCYSCPSNLNCLSCYQQNKFTKDHWKIAIRAYYRANIETEENMHKFTLFALSQDDSDYEILCTVCKSGYEFHGDYCIQSCPESCLECVLVNSKNICIKCPLSLNGRNLVQRIVIYVYKEMNKNYYQLIHYLRLIQSFIITHINAFQDLKEFQIKIQVFIQIVKMINAQNKQKQNQIQFVTQMNTNNKLINQKRKMKKLTSENQIFQVIICFHPKAFFNLRQTNFILLQTNNLLKKSQQRFLVLKIKDAQQMINQEFSTNIFSAINVELEIYGNNVTSFKFQKQLLFSNFSRIRIEGVQLEVEYFSFGRNLLKFSSLFKQTIELVDVIYEQDFNLTTFYTIIENAKNVLIQNFLVKNCTRKYPIDSFFQILQINSMQTIKIQNFQIINSSFQNVKLFWFDLKLNDQVEIQNVNIEQTYFDQAFLYQTNGLLKLNQIHIYSCQISSLNGLFEVSSLQQFELISLDFIQNQIYNGSIISLNQQTKMMKLNFVENYLYNNSFIIENEKSTIQDIFMQEVTFELNQYNQNASFIKITSHISSNKNMIINQLSMIENKLLSIPAQSTFNILNEALIYLEIDTIMIEQLIIQKANGIHDLVIINANEIKLNQIKMQQSNNQISQSLYLNLDCYQKFLVNHYDSLYMKIIDVSMIDIKQLVIQKAQSNNNPVIEIKTSNLQSQTQKFILLSEMHFYQNLLLTTNKFQLNSIMKISTEDDYDIKIKNSLFERNAMHQYIYMDQINSGLIFLIDCKDCTILFDNLTVKGNIVTNSSNSIIYIQTKSIVIKNCTFIQNSLFDYSLLQPYLYWGFQKDQNIFIEQIIQKFPIKVKTGNGKIVCQQIVMKNIQIYNSTSSGFQIYLEKDSSLQVQDVIIQFISGLFISEDENGGAFLIDTSISVSTKIQFINIQATNINCRNKGGFLYLQNALESTKILLQNLVIKDVYSLKGSLIYVEFSSFTNSKQQLILENLELTNTQQGYLSFISKFNQPNLQLLSELKLQRSLIDITYSKLISLKNLQIVSLLYEALAIFQQTLIIEMLNCKILNSTLQNSLLQLSLMQDSRVKMVGFYVSNIELLDQIPNENKCTSIQNNLEEIQQICSNNLSVQDSPKFLISKFVQDHLSNGYCIINKMNAQKNSVIGLMNINPDETLIQISQLNIKNINCKVCKQGLLDIRILDQQTRIIMISILFVDNQCGQQSCLNIMKSIQASRILQSLIHHINQKNYEFKLVNYKCVGNYAYQGTCLQIQDTTTLIKDSLLQNNTAESLGGSIYLTGNSSFFVLNTVIQFNKAQYGGGLFLKNQIIQNLKHQETLINDNKGTLFGDNSAQLPSQLSVSIDLQHTLPKIKILEKENILIEQIQIPRYSLFSSTYSGSLYVPNGQIMSEYQYFDQQKQEYIQYNLHLRLYALDQQNNIQQKLDGSKCSLSGRILIDNEDSDFKQDFMSPNQAIFNQTDYNFDDIIFYLNNQQNITLQLQFHCDSIFTPIYGKNTEILGYHNNYFLRMNIKSLPCQLGEIIYDGICLPCNATQGLYSLILPYFDMIIYIYLFILISSVNVSIYKIIAMVDGLKVIYPVSKAIQEHYVKNVIFKIQEDLDIFQQVGNILVAFALKIIKILLLLLPSVYGLLFLYQFLQGVMYHQMNKYYLKKQFQNSLFLRQNTILILVSQLK